jgi:ribonuclease R
VNDMADSKGVSRWLRRIAEHPRRAVLESMLLRSMKQAVYDTSNIGHFGLASTAYVHFTSPIRRYPDVQVHRAVKRLLRGAKPETTPAALELLSASATEASQRERAAMDVEREVVDVYRTLFMRDRIGEIAEGTVTALTGSGAFVTLDHPFVDVLVRYESMGPDRYELDEEELSATGARSGDQINIGDRMLVTIEDIALMRRMVFARRVLPEKLLKSLDQDGKRNRRGSNRPPRRDGGRQNDRGKWGRRPGRRRN